ncbi:MAG: AP2 domain-containing protein [Comamonadaceae bacterium]|nr:MAG: AP2 domain-containing protein [Comamonadaceae bacterium]
MKKWGSAARELAIKEREKQLLNFEGLSYIHPAEPQLRMGERSVPPEEVSAAELAQASMKRGRSTNQSGTPGVVRRKGRGNHPGYWTAQSAAGGRWLSKSFSVALFGEDEAKRLAIEERAAHLTQRISQRRSEKDTSASSSGTGPTSRKDND